MRFLIAGAGAVGGFTGGAGRLVWFRGTGELGRSSLPETPRRPPR
jgi:hypothetical protein